MADNSQNGGDAAVNVPAGSVTLLSDPVDVIIDKLLRYALLTYAQAAMVFIAVVDD
jgi:hypothetical protein